jgi:DUF4097 and DUF4098 domain-containing protein YvlB
MEPRTFDTPDGLELALQIPAGMIQVRAEETDETRLDITGERDEDDFLISLDDVGARGHRLKVEYRKRGIVFGWGGGDVRVDLTVPTGTQVGVETGSADLEISGSIGSLDVKSGSGDCRFGAVDGDVSVKTASGDVTGETVTGRLAATTASGDARVRLVHGELVGHSASGDFIVGDARSARVTTASGDVEIGAVRSGHTTIRSVSGDVEVGVPRGTRAYLDLASTSGSTMSDLDMSGDAGDGQAQLEIHVSTVSGDIRVVRGAADA